MIRSNEDWARQIITRLDPTFKPRWEVFDAYVEQLSGSTVRCLNIGSGIKEDPESKSKFGLNVDTDILNPPNSGRRHIRFVQADVYHLPFKDDSFDVILMRFIVEHLKNPQQVFHEVNRILTSRGKVVILTTNLLSPLIWLAKLIPYKLRKYLMKKAYGVADENVFPTHHRLNTRGRYKKIENLFTVRQWQYLQDANWNHRWLFIILFAFHLKTKWFGLYPLRSNFIAVLEKI